MPGAASGRPRPAYAARMIRPLERDDRTSWGELWDAYLRFYRSPLAEEVTEATFQRLVARADGLFGLVAEGASGRLVGLAHLVFHASTWSVAPCCYLEDLFVAPAARGRGTARELLDAVYAEADRRRSARTYWETQQYNGPARSLYDQVARPTSFVVYER